MNPKAKIKFIPFGLAICVFVVAALAIWMWQSATYSKEKIKLTAIIHQYENLHREISQVFSKDILEIENALADVERNLESLVSLLPYGKDADANKFIDAIKEISSGHDVPFHLKGVVSSNKDFYDQVSIRAAFEGNCSAAEEVLREIDSMVRIINWRTACQAPATEKPPAPVFIVELDTYTHSVRMQDRPEKKYTSQVHIAEVNTWLPPYSKRLNILRQKAVELHARFIELTDGESSTGRKFLMSQELKSKKRDLEMLKAIVESLNKHRTSLDDMLSRLSDCSD